MSAVDEAATKALIDAMNRKPEPLPNPATVIKQHDRDYPVPQGRDLVRDPATWKKNGDIRHSR